MKKFVLLSAIFLLSACGFHLKGLGNHALNLNTLYVQSAVNPYNENEQQAYQALIQALQDSGVSISKNEKDSQYKLIVSDFRFSSRQMAIGGKSGDTREIEITDSYTIALFQAGTPLGENEVISRRNMAYNAEQYLGSTQEERNAHEELARENAYITLRFIQAKIANKN